MTSPTPNARSSRLLPRRPYAAPPSHSIDAHTRATSDPTLSNPTPPNPAQPPFSVTPSPSRPAAGAAHPVHAAHAAHKPTHEHAIDFATHSWDLATGGLKTLTAKRELPMRPDRRTVDTLPDDVSRSYLFALVVLACLVLMLVGGGVVLFVMLQP